MSQLKRSQSTQGRKTVTKKAKPVTARTVRQMILRAQETKKFMPSLDGFSGVLSPNNFYLWNPLYWMSFGATDSTRIGGEIYIEKIELSFTMQQIGTSTQWNQPTDFYLGLVWGAHQQHDGTIAPNVAGNASAKDIRVNGTGSYARPIVDSDIVKVIWQHYGTIPEVGIADVSKQTNVRKTIKIGKKFVYDGIGASGYSRDKQLYLYFAYRNQAGNLTTCVSPQYCVYYKDA